jgi:hypothetical protein
MGEVTDDTGSSTAVCWGEVLVSVAGSMKPSPFQTTPLQPSWLLNGLPRVELRALPKLPTAELMLLCVVLEPALSKPPTEVAGDALGVGR